MANGKVRIFELAKELNMTSKDLIALFGRLGLEANNQLSVVEPKVADLVRTQIPNFPRGQVAEAAKAAPKSAFAERIKAMRVARETSISCGPLGTAFRASDNRNFTGATLIDEGVKFTAIGVEPWVLRYEVISGAARAVRENVWSHLAVPYSNQVFRLHGIPHEELPPFVTQLNERTKPYRDERDRLARIESEKERLRLEAEQRERERRLREQYDSHEHGISAVIDGADALFSGKRYVRFSDTDAWAADANAITPHFDLLPTHLLSLQEKLAHDKVRKILKNLEKITESANERFIEAESATWSGLFDAVEKQSLTTSQRRVCIIDEERQRIIAGAGTGKTSSMVSKVAYLICSGKAQPAEIFALSYGAASAKELKTRVGEAADRLLDLYSDAGEIKAVQVSTIHKMANATLRRANQRFSLTPLVDKENTEALRAQVQKFIEQVAKEPEIGESVITYLANHSEAEQTPGSFETYEHYVDWFRHCKLMTFRREIVKSFAEVDMANFFTLNQIAYKYEYPYEFQEDDPAHGIHKPDFYLPDHNIYVEHFGTDKSGHTAPGIDNDAYLAGMEWKRQMHRANGTVLVETEQWMRSEGVLIATLAEKLQALNVELRPIPVEAALALANEHDLVTTLASLICDVLPAFKESRLSMRDLVPISKDPDKARTVLFFRIFARVFDLYQAMLAERGEIDFADMIANATSALRTLQELPEIKYILVDEFQDVSPGRGAFIKALAERTNASLCVVGDDWQAIYSFSGCDGALFTKFDSFFGRSTSDVLTETFRFNETILNVSSDFVQSNPSQMRKALTTTREREPGKPAVILFEKAADAAPNAALEYLRDKLNFGGDVLLLTRTNFAKNEIPLQDLRQKYKFKKVRAMTAHAAKGGEADSVVILGASDDMYGFPLKREPDPILKVVLPPVDAYAYAEERRLFYVGLTRARDHVLVCFDPKKPSVFVSELAKRHDVITVTLDGLPLMSKNVVCRLCHQGTYVYRETTKGKKPFYGCSNIECKEVADPCPVCSGVKDIEGEHWVCARIGCSYRVPKCPRCRRGDLRLRSQGAFLGCSRFRGDDASSCRYTTEEFSLLDPKPPVIPQQNVEALGHPSGTVT